VKTIDRLATLLQTSFGELAEQSAAESKVIKRRRKFDASTLAKSFILAMLAKPTANEEDIASMAASVGLTISPQAVEQRYSDQLVAFFRSLFAKMSMQVMHSESKLAPLLERFTSVKLIDSSVISLPPSLAAEFAGCGGVGEHNTAAVKLQTELDLANGELQCIQLEPGKSPDQATNRQVVPLQKGSLRIADLGYFSSAVLSCYAAWGAFFLTRLLYNVKIKVDDHSEGLVAWLSRQNDSLIDCDVTVGQGTPLDCRLIAWRIPKAIAAKRRREVRKRAKKKGRTPSQDRLAACDWNFLATNLAVEQLSVQEAIVLYRSRWQIELLFKRWKTYCQIDLMDGRTDTISMARFWVRLCGALLQQWLVILAGWFENSSLSFAKIAKRLANWMDELASCLVSHSRLCEYLAKIRNRVLPICKRTKRRKKPGTAELLRDPNLLEYSLT
jgi:hypothetical protein